MEMRKFLAITLAVTFALAMSITAFAADTPSSWAKKEVNKAIELALVPEELQSDYTAAITREEFCILVMGLADIYDVVAEEEEAAEEAVVEEEEEAVEEEAVEEDAAEEAVSPFEDTDNEYVVAAYELGIVNGKAEGVFDPNGSITRQEAATMLTRAAKVFGMDIQAEASAFADADKVAGYAKAGVDFVFAQGVMNGTGDDMFTPAGTYTREQSIMTVLRLCNVINGDPAVEAEEPEEEADVEGEGGADAEGDGEEADDGEEDEE